MKYLKIITNSALAMALVTIVTMVIAIPVGTGYVNPSDAVIIIFAIIFGPIVGVFAGLGAAWADLFLGYGYFILFTIIAKTLMGFLVGKYFGKNKFLNCFLIMFSLLWMIVIYMLADYVILGHFFILTNVVSNIIQAFMSFMIVYFVLLFVIKRF